jgi:murein DD-endopeptidase MepM/ murein hydrolase activator NlpD
MKKLSRLFLLTVLIVLIALPASVIAATYLPSTLRPSPPAGKPALILPFWDPAVKQVSGFGTATHNDINFTTHTHYGVDFATSNWGTFEVVAAAGGTLTQMTWKGSLPANVPVKERSPGCDEDIDPTTPGSQARVAVIDHGNGWRTIYMHLSQYLRSNGPVSQGDPIGIAGCSGTYWPHLHFELRNYFPEGAVWSYNPDFPQVADGPSLDIAFLIDTTGSMYDDIDRVKADATRIVNSIKDSHPNSRIAVLDFRDFPSRTGEYYDYPYQDVLPFTYSRDEAINAIQSLTLGYGGDLPETQNCAIMHVVANDRCAGMGANTTLGPWASSSKRIIVMTDADALNPEPFTGFTLDQVAAKVRANNFTFELYGGGGTPSDFGGDPPPSDGVVIYPVITSDDPDAVAYGQALASATGGTAFVAPEADVVVDRILDALASATATFTDVPTTYWSWQFVERLYSSGITGGCGVGPMRYCPEGIVTRAEMAVFLERGIHGASFVPPDVGSSTGFGDVPPSYWSASFIKQLVTEGITVGCGGGNYCPEQPVTRAQMAVFLLRSKYGGSYAPPDVGAGTGFGDVPPDYWSAAWIKQLVTEGITAGCGGGNYCPEQPVARAQMAVFLVKTFGLP